ncbi:MAG TPA: cytochrome c oxidase assembly protein [Candidatus Acidoferrum sp.]|nr:cytochrome c oxidase assembly protein [Candidatus Acidoferrum sp.]
MSPEAQSVLQTWSNPTWINVTLVLTAVVYTRGWLSIRRLLPALIPVWRLAAFLAGLLSLWIAIGSPLSAFDDVSLSAHMVQHLLLMAVAPPLLLLGAPSIPFLRGLPQWIVTGAVGPFLRSQPVKWLGHFLTHPAVCWVVATVALLAWHIPDAFELALRSEAWHDVEHICFLSTSILFWWPAVLPFPSDATWSRWSIPVYLFLATLPGGALGAFLTFCDRVVYPSYATAPRLFGISPLEDQVIAGALMWVFGTFVYTLPAVFITVRLLSPQGAPDQKQRPLGLRRILA